MKNAFEYFEIRDVCGRYGLCGTYESEEKALAEINRSYEYAKTQGFDNKNEKYIIICNQVVREFGANGEFLKEEITRFVIQSVEYSDYDKAFVFVY